MVNRSSEAQSLLDGLDAELAQSGEQQGLALSWTTAERQSLWAIADTIDRRVALSMMFEKLDPDDVKSRVKLSTEIRQCDSLTSRMLVKIRTDMPAAESKRTVQARRAVRARWDHAAS